MFLRSCMMTALVYKLRYTLFVMHLQYSHKCSHDARPRQHSYSRLNFNMKINTKIKINNDNNNININNIINNDKIMREEL